MGDRPFPSLRNRSTIDNLSTILGTEAPASLRETLELFHRHLAAADYELRDLVCFELVGRPLRTSRTPPEVIPFGEIGVDGVHLGWVNRTPEIPAADFPVARISPLGPDFVCEAAGSIPEAFLLELSLWADVETPDHAHEAERARQAAETMGLTLIPAPSRFLAGPAGSGRPLSVSIPDGYHFVPAADNVGILAPAGAFQLKDEADLVHAGGWPAENVSRLAADLVERFPATALFHYKCLWWNGAPEDLWAEGMQRSYLALDRPLLAGNVPPPV